jgi:hypothetical protein
MEAVIKHTKPPRSVEWEGKTYLPGETIPDLSSKEAKRLEDLGLIEAPEKGKKGPGKGDEDKDPDGKGPGKEPDGGGKGGSGSK